MDVGAAMRAAVVRAFGAPPSWSDFPEPAPEPGERVVAVSAAAVNPLVLTRASGAHYSAGTQLPFVAGVDGVGRSAEGDRVYFRVGRPPYGSLAERVPVPASRTLPVPAGVSDVTAAASAIPGVSSWIPLTRLAPVRTGEAVLINGATGSAGRMAVQIARHLGVDSVIATGRDPAKLHELNSLGASEVVPLGEPWDAFRSRVRELVQEVRVGVVIDYLWGPSAEAILAALGGPAAPRGSARVRYVSVGAITAEAVALPSAVLRSSGVEILGSGIGASPDAEIVEGTREFFAALEQRKFRVDAEEQPMPSVERNWGRTGGERRLVFTLP